MIDTSAAKLLSADEAAERLNVSRGTLYCYVSRGLVRAFRGAGDPRKRLYAAADVEALLARKVRMRRPGVAASTALDWGLPVLESAITQLKGGRLFYRGVDVVHLAEHATLEEAACILWRAPYPETFATCACPSADPTPGIDTPIERILLALASAPLPPEQGGRRLGTGASGQAALLRLSAAAAIGRAPDGRPIHEQLSRVWGAGAEVADHIRRALVLSADHELTVSSFAVRVVASTGASLEKALMAGLGALSGPRHAGGEIDDIHRLFALLGEGRSGWKSVRDRLRSGEPAPGFDHPLYPEGDPRAAMLLAGLPLGTAERDLLDLVADEMGGHPMLSFALAALERSARLPPAAAHALFAIGRTAGWIAHAVEQHENPRVIRPRAKYVEI